MPQNQVVEPQELHFAIHHLCNCCPPLVVPVVEVFVIQRSLVLDGAGPFWEAWG